jgi:hypothetical protein
MFHGVQGKKEVGKMIKITNYKIQITNKLQTKRYSADNLYKEVTGTGDRCRWGKEINPKGSHGLHQDSFMLQTMTALIKSFCGGVQGGQFFQKAPPLVAEGRRNGKGF